MKKSFIVYHDNRDIFDMLTDEELGKLFRAMYEYSDTGKINFLPKDLNYIFIPIKRSLDSNAKKYALLSDIRSRSGMIGGLAKASKRKQTVAKASKAADTATATATVTDKDTDKDINTQCWQKRKPSNEFIKTLSETFEVPTTFVESRWDDMVSWCMATGKSYKKWDWALRDWVKRDAIKLKQGGQHGRRISVIPIR